MDSSVLRCAGVAALLLAAGAAFGQAPTTPSVIPSPAVMNDVMPLPAEERDSLGAIVLENSMVRAQRQAAARHTSLRVSDVGRGVMRAEGRGRTKQELQQQRDDDAMRLHEMGAGSLTPR